MKFGAEPFDYIEADADDVSGFWVCLVLKIGNFFC